MIDIVVLQIKAIERKETEPIVESLRIVSRQE